MRKPDLFLIGGARCGTTSMASYLAGHPEIFWSTPKELWYFCRPDLPNRIETTFSPADYLDFFKPALPEQRYLAEGSVSYFYAEGAVQRILEFNPAARFIVMLRNPLEAVVSLHRRMLLNDQESEADFTRAWRLQETRRQGRQVPWKCQNAGYLMYRDWCLWGRHLERVFRVAGRDRVCVMLFDDFKPDPRGAYEKILDFLGLESDGRTQFAVENQGRSYRHQRLVNVIDLLLTAGSHIRRTLKLPASLTTLRSPLRKLKQLQMREAGGGKPSSAIGDELQEAFAADIMRLSRLLGRDLRAWLHQ